MVSSWYWPGRILFDGVQHRWNKWVLDYSLDDQVGIFSGLLGTRTLEELGQPTATPAESSRSPWGALALLLLAAAGWCWVRAAGPTFDPETQIYLQLRSASSRAGVGVTRGLTPLALVDRIRAERAAAARAAERVVDLYLRGRSGREELRDSELREMREALKVARRALRSGSA